MAYQKEGTLEEDEEYHGQERGGSRLAIMRTIQHFWTREGASTRMSSRYCRTKVPLDWRTAMTVTSNQYVKEKLEEALVGLYISGGSRWDIN